MLLLAGPILYLSTLTPSNEGPWREEQEKSFYAELSGRSVTLHNIRDLRSDDPQQAPGRPYFSKTFQLDDIERIWFGLSHFGPYGLAHSILSIEFSDGEYVAISIEARTRLGQVYHPIRGLFRQYTKVYIAATEQDIIGRRLHQRGETVLLYPVIVPRENMERFFLALIADANALYETPEFYDAILDNCLTNLVKNSARMSEVSATDSRMLLPGRVDRLTYAFGITPDDIPFESARQRALTDPNLAGMDDPVFSEKIRCGWNGYAGMNIPACP